MPVVRDIKRRDSRKILNLQKDEKKMSSKKSDFVLDLSKERVKKTQKKASDITHTKQNKSSYTIIHQTDHPPKKSKKDLIQLIASAAILVFLFNAFNIGHQFFSIAADVEVNAFEGYNQFIEGGKDAAESNFGGAVQYFESASYAFQQAREKVWFLGNKSVVQNKESIGDSAYSLLESGSHLANGASYFSQGISALQEIPILFLENNIQRENDLNVKPVSLTEKLKSALTSFNYALDEVEDAKYKIDKAGPEFLPSNLQEHYNTLSGNLSKLITLLQELKKRVPAILSMLGDRYPHRYLVLLQNNSESRPTGGFIGSYLIVDVNDGYITKADFHDIYELDGQLNEFIPAPREIAALAENWRMRDSNYSPDFSISAEKAAWFLEKEGGPGVDTVIAINQSLLKDLLIVTGPINIEGLDAQLTSSNYQTVLTYIVESKLEGKENPKSVIGRVVPSLEKALYNQTSHKNLLAVIQKQIKEKNILGWSKDSNIQHFFDEVGMSALVKDIPEDQDYLNIVNINVGGNKSDRYIESEILHETVIEKSGEIRNVLTYTRRHTWNPEVILEWKEQLKPFGYSDFPEWLQNILGRGNNKSVIKIYLPKDSELEDIVGVEREDVTIGYDEELNKTFMYFTDEVAPQNESVVTITYKLPYKLDLGVADEYRLTVQKQPGILNVPKLKKRIISDNRITNYRNYPDEVVYAEGDVMEYETVLLNDQHFASLWGIE